MGVNHTFPDIFRIKLGRAEGGGGPQVFHLTGVHVGDPLLHRIEQYWLNELGEEPIEEGGRG